MTDHDQEALSRHWPAPLRSGDTVALVAPSGPCPAERIDEAERLLGGWGMSVWRGDHLLDTHPRLRYLAGTDADRAAEFTAGWCAPEVTAVWAVRGGYGAQRMVDLVDYDALRRAGRKHLIGFSDITALHTRIGRELDQVTVHGPTATAGQLARGENVDVLYEMVTRPPTTGTTLLSAQTLVPGRAVGRLIGGNLSLIAADVGVEPAPAVPSVVIFEDVDEESYRLDRLLTQLRRSGWFDAVVGVLLGDFTEPDDAEVVERALTDRLTDLGVPVARRAPVGHADLNTALPLGQVVTLDAGTEVAELRIGD